MNEIIQKISDHLSYRDGIWFSDSNNSISYPNSGNEICYQIEENSFWFKHRNSCIMSVVKKYATKMKIFDIGGGNGYTSLYLEKNNIETFLIEPGINGILNAKRRKLKNLVCSSFQDARFKNNSIPNIGIFDVLEHIENDSEFLKDLNKVLCKKGKLFITVPAFSLLWSHEDDYAGHHRRYRIKKLKNKLSEANFEIEYSTYIFSILPLPIFLFRTIPYFFKKKRDINIENEKKQHKAGRLQNILEKIWKFELTFINNNKKIHFGGSCLIVAKRKNDTI